MNDLWYNQHTSVTDLGRMLGGYATRRWFWNWVHNYALKTCSLEEQLTMRDYMCQILLRKKSAERCVTVILYPGAYAKIPLSHIISQLTMETAFYYGDTDWMDKQHAQHNLD